MDLNKSGGPAYPTLNGAALDDNTFRFEGMTLFDFYAGRIIASGQSIESAMAGAARALRMRNQYLLEAEK